MQPLVSKFVQNYSTISDLKRISVCHNNEFLKIKKIIFSDEMNSFGYKLPTRSVLVEKGVRENRDHQELTVKKVETWGEGGRAFNYGIVWGAHVPLFPILCAPNDPITKRAPILAPVSALL